MASTTFVDGSTPIVAAWLNDVNSLVYGPTIATYDVYGQLGASSPTQSIGYRAGSGSGVTQATSRTTSVTIDYPTGSIGMVSAAGSPTWQTFTVVNSRVNVTDVVVVSVRSATNLYSTAVTRVANGQFDISFAAVSGTAVDAPLLSFAVIRATIV
jgi:hypothetical protein